ncbi:hypothetical protein [Candidatus Electrothrix sp.]|uniref:hypothetical protein n=1 Tax=Candidatus Electrothrix sp. TaxID=2170559 RepID=UPI0040566791
MSVAEKLIAQGAIPVNSEEDALHIGLAASAGIDYLKWAVNADRAVTADTEQKPPEK